MFLKPHAINQDGGGCQNARALESLSTSYMEPAKRFHHAQASLLSQAQHYLQLSLLCSFYSKEMKILLKKKEWSSLRTIHKIKGLLSMTRSTRIETSRRPIARAAGAQPQSTRFAGHATVVGGLIAVGICALLR